jgi:cytoskeleton protein RodZ
MESFGAYLKSLREDKGKTLEEISESTKIAVANLVFLEQDAFDMLPPRVFVKGFVRSYVQELGLSPEEAVRRFDAFTKEGELPDYGVEDHPVFHQKPSPIALIRGQWFTVALTVLGGLSLIVLVVTAFNRLILERRGAADGLPTVTAIEPPPSQPATTKTEPSAKPTQAVATGPSRAQAGKKTLKIKAVATTWVWVQPDEGPAEERVMAPGDIQYFTAKSGFRLQIGNAGGLRIQFDGRELPPLGKMNQTVSITLP